MQTLATNKWLVVMLGIAIQMLCVGMIPWQLVWKLNSWNPNKDYKTKHSTKGERKNKEKGPKSEPKLQKPKVGHKLNFLIY